MKLAGGGGESRRPPTWAYCKDALIWPLVNILRSPLLDLLGEAVSDSCYSMDAIAPKSFMARFLVDFVEVAIRSSPRKLLITKTTDKFAQVRGMVHMDYQLAMRTVALIFISHHK